MAEQKNEENIIFLPWTVEPKYQNYTLDVNHSTDTTAMKSFEEGSKISIASFDYATGIAVFLALCATGLAYWFGARSFILTKQSFDAVIAQIKSSEQLTLESNKTLISSQDSQKRFELMYQRKQSDRAEFRRLSFQYIHKAKFALKFLTIKLGNIEDQNWEYLVQNHYDEFVSEFQERIDKDFDDMFSLSLNLLLILDKKSKNYQELKKILNDIDRSMLVMPIKLKNKKETSEATTQIAKNVEILSELITEIISSDKIFN